MDSFVSCNEMEQHGTIIAIRGEGAKPCGEGGTKQANFFSYFAM